MDIEKLEAEVLRLDTKSRAKLAERLLVSLEDLTDQENAQLWAAEAQRRDAEIDADPNSSCQADEVFRKARSRIK